MKPLSADVEDDCSGQSSNGLEESEVEDDIPKLFGAPPTSTTI